MKTDKKCFALQDKIKIVQLLNLYITTWLMLMLAIMDLFLEKTKRKMSQYLMLIIH